MSQKKQILQHLRENGSITPLEALNKIGCFRLAARIHELRNEGHNIKRSDVEDYATYNLKTMYFKTEKRDFICESNREIKEIISLFFNDDLSELYSGIADKNGWFRINKVIYFRNYYHERKETKYFQCAVDKGKFNNKYLLQYYSVLISKMIKNHLRSDISWNIGTGKTLNIFGKGEATEFNYVEIEL